MADDDSFVEETMDTSGAPGDSYTEVTTQGWFGRLGDSIKGIVVGLVLIVGAGVLLFWNEGRTVKTSRALDEASHQYVSLSEARVDPANQGKLVYLTGELKTDEVLSDKAFNTSANAIRLSRMVEIYQWKQEEKSETTKNVGGSTTKRTTYTYTQQWADHLIDSNAFKKSEGHMNPKQVPFQSEDFWANRAMVGDFTVPRLLLGKLNNFEPLPIDASVTQQLPPALKDRAQVAGEWCYLGNPQQPHIGDLRVRFRVIRPGVVSLMARQVSGSFEPYEARSGKSVALIESGVHSAEGLIAEARSENSLIAWLLRAGGLLLMVLGLFLLLRPLSVVLDVIPLLGDIAGAGIGLVAFVVGLVVSLVIVAVAWFSYRPLLSVALAAGGVALLFLARKARGRRQPA